MRANMTHALLASSALSAVLASHCLKQTDAGNSFLTPIGDPGNDEFKLDTTRGKSNDDVKTDMAGTDEGWGGETDGTIRMTDADIGVDCTAADNGKDDFAIGGRHHQLD